MTAAAAYAGRTGFRRTAGKLPSTMPSVGSTGRATQEWQDLADGSGQFHVRQVVECRLLRIHDDDLRADFLRRRDRTSDRINLQTGSNSEQAIGFVDHFHRTFDHLTHERLSEGDRVALQNSAA